MVTRSEVTLTTRQGGKLPRSYTQSQLMLPLLSALSEAGGSLGSKEAIATVAASLTLPTVERDALVPGTDYRQFDRDVRWARQRSKFAGFVRSPKYGEWQITGAGRKAIRDAKPGIIVTLYESEDGVALWADCRDAFSRVEEGSLALILSSPPYPLVRQKDYGNLAAGEYVDWMADLAASWRPLLADNGSLVLNLGDCWEAGHPSLSLYAERLLIKLVDDLGYRLAQRFEWHNPSKMPAPAEWVTVRRVRAKPSLERIYWLSKGDAHPYADNRQVLVPYSKSMRKVITNGGEKGAQRPSGHELKASSFSADCGGAIPSNLLIAANTSSNSAYQNACREAGLPIHPARFPEAIPDWFIRFLSKPGDVVADPFGGSFCTASVARSLGRRFITAEKSLDYALGGLLRLGGCVPPDLLDRFSRDHEGCLV